MSDRLYSRLSRISIVSNEHVMAKKTIKKKIVTLTKCSHFSKIQSTEQSIIQFRKPSLKVAPTSQRNVGAKNSATLDRNAELSRGHILQIIGGKLRIVRSLRNQTS